MRRRSLLLHGLRPFLFILLGVPLGSCGVELSFCKNKKIYVLDLNDYAGDSPRCVLDEVVTVNPSSGIVYTVDARLRDDERVSHKYGTHSAPWYVAQAIRGSDYITDDIEEADVVFVDSYCYYIWWLGWVHTKGRELKDTPGDYLVAAFTRVFQSNRFQRNEGADYVFYDSHPGFTAGNAANSFWAFICHVFEQSMHIVVERAQRNVCPTYWTLERKLLITPYVPNYVEQSAQYEDWLKPLKPFDQRGTFIYAKARCTPYKIDADGNVLNVGKKMRHDFVKVMQLQGSDVQVECTDGEFNQTHEKFGDMLAGMQNAKFCLALPGDAASVRRMSEIFMAGCIPVFVGPPYATMPLAADVDYRRLGLFYNVSSYHSWMSQDFEWAIHPTVRASYAQQAKYWVPDADVLDLMVSVASASDVIPHLRSIPVDRLRSMFASLESQRQMFAFYEQLTPYWSAVNAIVSRMCAAGATRPQTSLLAREKGGPLGTGKLHKERQKRARRSHRTGELTRARLDGS